MRAQPVVGSTLNSQDRPI